MPLNPPDLEGLRRRLDEIDDRLHDLLIERSEVVGMVAASKRSNGNLAAYAPGREAEILRRLAARHRGGFPLASLVRMWREMLAGTVRLQSPFSVAVFISAEAQGFWDLARDHYGSHTPMTAYRSIGQVIRAVSEGAAAVGVLPKPEDGEPNPWWRQLVSKDESGPRIIARLPFGARGNARTDGAEALAIGRGVQQPTGADRSLFAMETAADISRSRVFGILSGTQLECTFLTACEQNDSAISLIELDGFVAGADPRFDGLRAQLGKALFSLLRLGGYALPLPASAFSPAAAAAGTGGAAILDSARG